MSTPEATHAAPASPSRAWLAVEVAGQGLLFPLTQAGEIFSDVPILRVAHTQPWFCGVANLRSNLFGVIDLAAFLGLRSPEAAPCGDPSAAGGSGREPARLLALNTELQVQCALKVDQLAGLRRMDDMTPMATQGYRPAFAVAVWQDPQGRLWQEIDLAALARSESFLAVAAAQAS